MGFVIAINRQTDVLLPTYFCYAEDVIVFPEISGIVDRDWQSSFVVCCLLCPFNTSDQIIKLKLLNIDHHDVTIVHSIVGKCRENQRLAPQRL